MHRGDSDLDIVLSVLSAVLQAEPTSHFAQSLDRQYRERGGLSKAQMEGLHSKASKIAGINPGWLATLEAIIRKKQTKSRSPKPQVVPAQPVNDPQHGDMINEIIAISPQHKRVLFLQAKYLNRELLTPADITDLKRFHQVLVKK